MKTGQKYLKFAMRMMVLTIGTLFLLVGCEDLPDEQGKDNEAEFEILFDKGFYRPESTMLNEKLTQWIEYSRVIPAVQEMIIDGERYLLITAGERPTPGYGVQVQEAVVSEGVLQVRVAFSSPREGDILAQVITYPYDMIILEDRNLPLEVVNVDDPDDYFMNLTNIDSIDRPFVASNQSIYLFSPAPNTEIAGSVQVSGVASVFEGTVNYQLLADTGIIIDTGYMQASMGSWGYFEQQVAIPEDYNGEQLTLIVYSESAKDGSKMFVIEVPLSIKSS